jgi:cell fate regulator YaaT (PSP1 superfamily)
VYDFDAGHFVINAGDMVIVDTEQGLALGQVVRGPRSLPEEAEPPEGQATDQAPAEGEGAEAVPEAVVAAGEPAGEEAEPEAPRAEPAPVRARPELPHAAPPLKSIYRMATADDLAQAQSNARLEAEAYAHCQERIAARKLDMNLVKVESLFDRSKVIFYFTAEGRLDFRELVKDLVARFRTRVELRQIGVRHEAKLLGGIGSCGRELCCATFLKDFAPVSVKMAKEQNLSLNPTKISGLCGRLMCCLTYEYETYQALKKDLPKLGKKVVLGPDLEAKVIRQNVLERKVTLILPDGREATVTPEEIPALAEELRNPPPPPPRSGRDRPPAHPPAHQQAPPNQTQQPPAQPAQNQQTPSEQTPDGSGRGGSRGRGRRRRSQKGPSER